MKTITTLAVLALTASAAHAEMVTTGDLTVVCTTHYAVYDAITAVINKPESMRIAEVMEPLGCVNADAGFTFIPTGASCEAVLPGIIIMPSGKKLTVYVNEDGLRSK